MKKKGRKFIPVYVWQAPVRIFHLLNATAIVVLAVTGFLIGNPQIIAGSYDATKSFAMGWIRNIHFIAGYVFFINLLVRFYWSFVGNKYARMNIFKKQYWIDLVKMLRYYLFIDKTHPHYTGHNPIAELTYLLFIGLGGLVISITGFYMLYEIQPHSFLFSLVSWLNVFADNSMVFRNLHHWIAWGIVMFVVIHVYMSIRMDKLDKDATISSIITGYKHIDVEEIKHEESLNQKVETDKKSVTM